MGCSSSVSQDRCRPETEHLSHATNIRTWTMVTMTLTVLTKIISLQMENICLSSNFHPHYECMGLTNDSVCDAFTGLIYRSPSLQLSRKLIGKIIQFRVETWATRRVWYRMGWTDSRTVKVITGDRISLFEANRMIKWLISCFLIISKYLLVNGES